VPATPVSVRTGTLSPAKPTFLDPNYLNYTFSCDRNVTGFTVLINRRGRRMTR
jgi:hypothetical protein